MRPAILNPFFSPIESIPGVGPQVSRRLSKLIEGQEMIDLLFHLPREIIQRKLYERVSALPIGKQAIFMGTVLEHNPPPPKARQRPWQVAVCDETGDSLILSFFHARAQYLKERLPLGQKIAVAGKIDSFQANKQISHPDFIEPVARLQSIPLLEAVYPLSAGLTNRQLAKFQAQALSLMPSIPEWIDEAYLKGGKWPNFAQSLRLVHQPTLEAPIELARQRLAFDELLANQLALRLVRRYMKVSKGRVTSGKGDLRLALRQNLPFTLTHSQQKALDEIEADMQGTTRMLRLLQGDVGSGKTIVGLFAMLAVVELHLQAALLVPTEILARQHFQTMVKLIGSLPVRVGLLLGRGRGALSLYEDGEVKTIDRQAFSQRLKAGSLDLVVGTHALVQDSIEFADLALVVVDEQHRFGVHQRLNLSNKGRLTDVLVMTATPIPRTLMLTAYGDLDHSRLSEKPAGRQPIKTVVIPRRRLAEIIDRLGVRLQEGGQAYWICPLVEQNDELPLTAVEDRFAYLQKEFTARFGQVWQDKIAIIHGRLKPQDKEAVMIQFAEGKIRLLVATTVVEVGMDVPSATIMVIEHAEHFGLAQLHQLRGRIGRGQAASSCLLLRADQISQMAKQRLGIISDTEDGYHIAETDLRLRGAGEMLGVRQSGLPRLRLADWQENEALIAVADRAASEILARDELGTGPKGDALRLLLYLFRHDRALDYVRSG